MVMVMADTKSFWSGLLALPPTGMSLPLCSFGLSLPAARQEVRAPFGYGIPATLGTLHELDMAVDERPLLSRILLRRRVRRWCDVHLGKHLTHTKLPWLDGCLAISRATIVVDDPRRAGAESPSGVAAHSPRPPPLAWSSRQVHRAAQTILKGTPRLARFMVLLIAPSPIPRNERIST